MFLYLHVKRYP